jgi:hypothetical protein
MQIKPSYSAALAAAGLISVLAGTPTAHAQSSDALIDKLVDKGILTVDEAQSLRDEADKDFTRALTSKNGMPEWVKTLKLNGDFRGRYEGFYGNEGAFVDRNRLRYRLRFGITAGLTDSFEVGFRLASGDATAAGGLIDPISTNQTLDNNGAKKGIYIDQAYVRWKGLNTADLNGSITFGKMDNPFVYSDMVFDGDYTPEGLAGVLAYRLNEAHALSFMAGGFSLKELGGSSADSFMAGAQLRWDADWNAKLKTSVGAGVLALTEDQALGNAAVPNIGVGNTRDGAGNLVYNMNPFVLDAAATYTVESFPMYPTAFPIKIAADYMQNPSAPDDRNSAWSAGVTFGKSGKKGTWEIAYRYKVLESDAWFEEVVDSDFGAYYGAGLANAGQGAGYRNGTNARGHIVKASYSPYDFLTLGLTYFFTEAISEVPANTDSAIQRLQVDAVVKF